MNGAGDSVNKEEEASAGIAAHASLSDVVSLATFVLAACVWTAMSTGELSPRSAGFFLALHVCSVVWGRVVLTSLGAHRLAPRCGVLVFLVGCLTTSFLLAVVKLLTPLPLGVLFLMHVAVGAAMYAGYEKAIRQWTCPPTDRRYSLASWILTLAATLLWMQHLMPLRAPADNQVEYRFFVENYAHGCNTLPLTVDGMPTQSGSFHFAGEPLSFYHWASYTWTALARQLAGVSIVDGQAVVWYPLGMVVVGLAAYSLGAFWFRPAAGFWSAACILAIPDPSYWSTGVVALSFHRLLEASCAMSYMLAAAALSVIWTTLGTRNSSMRLLMAGILAAFAAAYFKVNIILMLWPVLMFVLLAARRRIADRVVNVATAGFLLLVVVAYLLGSRVRSAPTFTWDPQWGRQYMQWLSQQSQDGSWFQSQWTWQATADDAWNLLPRAVLVVLGTLGAWILPWGALLIGKLRRPCFDGHIPYVPLLTVLLYAAFAVGLHPNENGDPFELQHRAFIWPYFLVVVWTAGQARDASVWDRRASRDLRLGFALLAFPLVLGRQVFLPHGQLENGYLQCAEYLRTQTCPGDAVVDSRMDPWLMTVGMTERRAFVCFEGPPVYNFPGHGRLGEIHRQRRQYVQDLLGVSSTAEIRQWSEQHGVRWCLLHPSSEAAWPREVLRRAPFESGGYYVIDLKQP